VARHRFGVVCEPRRHRPCSFCLYADLASYHRRSLVCSFGCGLPWRRQSRRLSRRSPSRPAAGRKAPGADAAAGPDAARSRRIFCLRRTRVAAVVFHLAVAVRHFRRCPDGTGCADRAASCPATTPGSRERHHLCRRRSRHCCFWDSRPTAPSPRIDRSLVRTRCAVALSDARCVARLACRRFAFSAGARASYRAPSDQSLASALRRIRTQRCRCRAAYALSGRFCSPRTRSRCRQRCSILGLVWSWRCWSAPC
jgi:hypothetical protein